MVEQDTLVTAALTALTTKQAVRLQFGKDSNTAAQVCALCIWEDAEPREIVMLAVEKLYEKMVKEIKEYYDGQRHQATR